MLREVPYGSELYDCMTRLREEVLRIPLGLRQTPDDLRGEADQIHVAALDGDSVVGTLLMKPLSPTLVKFRQMAIATAMQGTGLGRRLVRFAETLAVERGFRDAELNARLSATGFYERLGYRSIGNGFLEIDIPHIKMWRSLMASPGQPGA